MSGFLVLALSSFTNGNMQVVCVFKIIGWYINISHFQSPLSIFGIGSRISILSDYFKFLSIGFPFVSVWLFGFFAIIAGIYEAFSNEFSPKDPFSFYQTVKKEKQKSHNPLNWCAHLKWTLSCLIRQYIVFFIQAISFFKAIIWNICSDIHCLHSIHVSWVVGTVLRAEM